VVCGAIRILNGHPPRKRGIQCATLSVVIISAWKPGDDDVARFRSAGESLAEKIFDQRICSPLRDAGLGTNLRHQSLSPEQGARREAPGFATRPIKGE
jgi:hypothetical protein